MGRGEPGLPRAFTWAGTRYQIVAVISSWRGYGEDRGDVYVRRHWYEVRTDAGHVMRVYFDRNPGRRGSGRGRWWLYSIESNAARSVRDDPVGDMEGQDMKSKSTYRGTKTGQAAGKTPSGLIDARIEELGDWRGETLARIRALIKQADPGVVEEWKWRGVPVWAHDGLICTGETYTSIVKMTFAKGASLKDPSGLFNASLDGNVRRAIDIHEGDKVDRKALKELVRAAVALNVSSKRR